MKWYLCLNEFGLAGFAEIILASTASAIANTSLEPHLLFDGESNAITEYLSDIGVTVHFHQNSFLDKINSAVRKPGYLPQIARGAYLRLDIPLVEQSDEYSLYTDVDVLFVKPPMLDAYRPAILAAAPEYATIDGRRIPYPKIFNSGVMLLNNRGFFDSRDDLIRFAEENGFYFSGDGGFYDQGALNKFFAERWDTLPQSLNSRPFSGFVHGDPSIIHFHGTKPYELAAIVFGDTGVVRDEAMEMFNLQPLSYLDACDAYLKYLPVDAVRLVPAVSPRTTGFSTRGLDLARERIESERRRVKALSVERSEG